MVIIPGIVASSSIYAPPPPPPPPPPLTTPLATVSFDAAQEFWAGGNAIQLNRTTTTEGQRCAISWDVMPATDDVEVLARVTLNRIGAGTAQPRFGIIARGGGGIGTETGVVFAVGDTGKESRLTQYAAGAFSEIIGASAADRVYFQRYWLRLRLIGADVQARIWLEGDTEPGTWTHEETTTVTSAGWVGLFMFDGTTRTGTCDYFATGTGGASAPAPADTPGAGQLATTFDEAAPLDDWTSRFGADLAYITRTDAQSQAVLLADGAYQPVAWRPEWGGILQFGWLSDRMQSNPETGVAGLRYIPAGIRADASVVSRVSLSGSVAPYIVGRASGTASARTCYQMWYSGGSFRLSKVVAGVSTTLGSFPATLTPSDKQFHMRMECQGTLIRARQWFLGDEPEGWDISVTDDAIATGWWGAAVSGGGSGPIMSTYDFAMQVE